MTPTLIAQEPNMPPQHLNDFTHRVWNLALIGLALIEPQML